MEPRPRIRAWGFGRVGSSGFDLGGGGWFDGDDGAGAAAGQL